MFHTLYPQNCEEPVYSFYHGFNGLDGFACVYWVQYKNNKNPLERMEGFALAVMLPPWSYKSDLLTPKTKAYHYLHS